MTTATTAIQLSAGALKTCDSLQSLIRECSMNAMQQQGVIQRAFTLAQGIQKLRAMITDEMMNDIAPLAGTSLGFRTDKDLPGGGTGYSIAQVKECLIEGLIRGVYPVGNEMNIIASRCYITREGFTRLVREVIGLTDLRKNLGVPRTVGDRGAIVAASATWRIGNKQDQIEREIPIKVNSGMGSDAILGKADRKLLCSIYNQIMGSSLSDGEVGDDDSHGTNTVVNEAESRTQRLASTLGVKPGTIDIPADAPSTPAGAQPEQAAEPDHEPGADLEEDESATEPAGDAKAEDAGAEEMSLLDQIAEAQAAKHGVTLEQAQARVLAHIKSRFKTTPDKLTTKQLDMLMQTVEGGQLTHG